MTNVDNSGPTDDPKPNADEPKEASVSSKELADTHDKLVAAEKENESLKKQLDAALEKLTAVRLGWPRLWGV
jgi:hypothetical protein